MRNYITRAHCWAFGLWLLDKHPIGHPVEYGKYTLFRTLQYVDNRFGYAAITKA